MALEITSTVIFSALFYDEFFLISDFRKNPSKHKPKLKKYIY